MKQATTFRAAMLICAVFTVLCVALPVLSPAGDAPEPAKNEKAEGFGGKATGGKGKNEIVVSQATASAAKSGLSKAASGNCRLVFKCTGDIDMSSRLPALKGNNVTLEGGGVTFWGEKISRTSYMFGVGADNVIIRNMRLRNAGDNLTTAAGKPSSNIIIEHCSSTGAGDDGISITYGTHDATLQWCLIAGCTRSIFSQHYDDTTRITMHHNLVTRGYMRNPLANGPKNIVDFRNNVVSYYVCWGSGYGNGCSGNIVNNTYIMDSFAKVGKGHRAIDLKKCGKVYVAGNAYRGQCKLDEKPTSATEIKCPPVDTQSAAESEKAVTDRAGALPRDEIDKAYLRVKAWSTGTEKPLRIRKINGKLKYWTSMKQEGEKDVD